MCGSGASWKREHVPDHKFDFIDTREFTDNGFGMRMKYLWLYIIVLKSFLVYISDIFSAITMLSTDSWSNDIFNKCDKIDGCIAIPFDVGRWLFFGCIIFSFLLLAYEARKSKKIIASRDISFAFTNVMANNYYSLRSYDHFCFFDHISNSTKTSDDFAFFIFFTFKSWKRLILADTPRQTINALTLYATYLAKRDPEHYDWYEPEQYFKGNEFSTSALTATTLFTVLICAGSLLILLVAALCYVPLLVHIQGNLKEYCCHKVDKRIDEIIKRRQKKRLVEARQQAKKEAQGDFSHLKNKKGELVAKPLPQPTLPNVSIDDIEETPSIHSRQPPSHYAASQYTADQSYYYNSDGKSDYPTMPGYNPYNNNVYQHNPHNQSQDDYSLAYNQHQHPYDDDNESAVNLAASAAPMGHIDRPGSTRPNLNEHYRSASPVMRAPSRTPPPPFASQSFNSVQDTYAYQPHQQSQDWSQYPPHQQSQHKDGYGGGHAL